MADERSSGFFFDVQKWRGSRSVQRMTFSERGVYLEMMVEQWEKRWLPDDARAVADRIAMTTAQVEEVLAAWDVVRTKFVRAEKGPIRIYNVSLERTRRQKNVNRLRRENAGREGGKAKAAKLRMQQALEASNARAMLGTAVAMPSDKTYIDLTRQDQTGQKKEPPPLVVVEDARRDPFTDATITARAGDFIRRYKGLFAEHQAGAKYLSNETRDYQAAVELCTVWEDARLEKLAICFLTTDHRFAAQNSRTIPRLKALASWLDTELAKWESERAHA